MRLVGVGRVRALQFEKNEGLRLGEAGHGNLQAFINENSSSIELSRRNKWCHQSAEVVAFIHSRGVKLVAAPEVAES